MIAVSIKKSVEKAAKPLQNLTTEDFIKKSVGKAAKRVPTMKMSDQEGLAEWVGRHEVEAHEKDNC